MKQVFKHNFLFICFWFLVFTLNQTIFLIRMIPKFKEENLATIFSSYYNALPLALSTVFYLIGLLVILGFFQLLLSKNILNQVVKFYIPILLIIVSIISIVELELYPEWGVKLNFRALMYLKKPKEIFETASWSFIITFFALCVIEVVFFSKLYFKKFNPTINSVKLPWYKRLGIATLYLIILAPLTALCIRGGIQKIPINQSSAFYCSNDALNQAAVNSTWNLIHSISKNINHNSSNKYLFLDSQKADSIVRNLHSEEKDTTIKLFNSTKPNIFIFLLEGWTADVVKSCGGDSGISPNFEKLISQGLLFNNCYSSGLRSEQGNASVFAGYPAQPFTSIIEQPERFKSLPNLYKPFKKNGYDTRYYFGGQLSYGNIAAYMRYGGLDKLVDLNDLSNQLPEANLGIHEEYMLDYISKELANSKQPFFTTFFTTSTHQPYDIPRTNSTTRKSEYDKYLKSVYYADSCIFNFMELNKNRDWFKNTVFVFISDHGHLCHTERNYFSPEHHKIPFLIYSPLLKSEFVGKKIERLVSQTDLPKTLLKQFDLESRDFEWSRNALNPYLEEFIFYSDIHGVGWKCKQGAASFMYEGSSINYNATNNDKQRDSIIALSKTYMQVLMDDFLKR